jgi:hypothetical protein
MFHDIYIYITITKEINIKSLLIDFKHKSHISFRLETGGNSDLSPPPPPPPLLLLLYAFNFSRKENDQTSTLIASQKQKGIVH